MQNGRFGQRFQRQFTNILDRKDYDVRLDPSDLAPERALVFEVIGPLAGFANTARRIDLEWLAEQLTVLEGVSEYLPTVGGGGDDDDDDDDDVADEDDGEAFLETLIEDADPTEDVTIGRLYVGMPTDATYAKLRSLWNLYKDGKPFPEHHSDWWALFGKLHDLRPWGPQDRISPDVRDWLARRVEVSPNQPVQIEIDLWYRAEPATRKAATALLKSRIKALGGEILDEAELEPVRYQAALVRLPFQAAKDLLALESELAIADEVMSVRPQSSFDANYQGVVDYDPATSPPVSPPPAKPALAALIDGYPVENHALLSGRLDVVELEVAARDAPVAERFHGTAMASLILYGDLALKEEVIDRQLKVVPILKPNAHGGESPPADKLVLAMIYRAVRDLKRGAGQQPPSGPDVLLINHSICDEAAPFTGGMSAWARTLDYLSYEYGVLFVVSAGNIRDAFTVQGFDSIKAFRDGEAIARGKAIVLGVDKAKAKRSMLSPAESVNSLTVGAAHSDGSLEALPATAVDPFAAGGLANIGSGAGLGFARAVKPDILMPGGRQAAQPSFDKGLLVHPHEVGALGQSVASPGMSLASLSKVRRSSGTSNAAAIATRAGLKIADALDATFDDAWRDKRTAPCLLKALIAHGGAWGESGEALADFLPPVSGRKRLEQRENISRFLGYGVCDVDRVVSAGQHRITLVAEDLIRLEKRHEYRIPLPAELSSRKELRRVTVTLAWLSPLRPGTAAYRAIGLNIVGVDGRSQLWSGVKRYKGQPPIGPTRRGTLMHAIYEGNSATPFDDDDHFVINVQTGAKQASGLTQIDIPYALAVTFEVAATINADIRESIRSRVQPRVRA
ncbi:MAG: hypothetical protein EBR82_20090 [Caulobacteraceae bacterium]|nr:hypothetical protein [Caulobacteraceae bacterium]